MLDLIVFTDLDGSLLNHEDYSFAEAMPALARISGNNIPLVFVTSKTRREVEILQREMGLREPFIVENGGGIYFPAGYRGWTIERAGRLPAYCHRSGSVLCPYPELPCAIRQPLRDQGLWRLVRQ